MSTPATAPPFASTVNVPGPFNFADPYGNYPGGNPFPGNFTIGPNVPFVAFGSFVATAAGCQGNYSPDLEFRGPASVWKGLAGFGNLPGHRRRRISG